MDRSCKNCRFCIYAHSMRGKEEPYCKRYSKWIGDTLLCSKWEMVSVPKPQTNADRIRKMSDEELAMLLEGCVCPKTPCPDIDRDTLTDKKRCTECWLDWLKEEAE